MNWYADIDETTQRETDAVTDRILDEWPWTQHPGSHMQREMKKLQDMYITIRTQRDASVDTEERAHLQEQCMVLHKKIKEMQQKFLQEYYS